MKIKQSIVAAALIAGAAVGSVTGAAVASADVTHSHGGVQASSATQFGELSEYQRFRYAKPSTVAQPPQSGRNK